MPSLSASIPGEIWRAIFSFATAPPVELFSDTDVIRLSDLRDLQEAINASFDAKCSLSLTCRLFHGLVDEFLHEIIVVRRAVRLHSLAKLLHQPRTDRPSRGWWCRMLYVQLKDMELDSQTTSLWSQGCLTLWGLVQACPHVVDLRCSIINFESRLSVMHTANYSSRIPPQLLQLIAHTYGPALRRLELLGALQTHIKDMERLLSACPVLEVCRLNGLDTRDSFYNMYDRALPVVSYAGHGRGGTSATEAQSGSTAGRAGWPSTSSNVVSLPNLRTLAVLCYNPSRSYEGSQGYTPDIRTWRLPSLTAVHAGMFISVNRSPAILDWFVAGLTIHSAHIKRFSYSGGGFDFWRLINLLSVVQSIKVPVDMDFSPSALPLTHEFLSQIQINSRLFVRMEARTREVLSEVLLVVQAGRLPALRGVEMHNSVVETDPRTIGSLVIDYRALKISLEMAKQTAMTAVGIFETDHSGR